MNPITITQPDDWHIHLRDEEVLQRTVNDVARWAGRAIIMPNLIPPVRTVADALAYRDRILDALVEESSGFQPLMTLYLTDATSTVDIEEAAASAHVHGVKLYPAGATTNSSAGVNDLESLYPVLESMAKHDMPLLVHGEVTSSDIDIFDREKVFIDRHLQPIVDTFPGLRVVFEHITTADAVAFVREARSGVAATITAHHLLYNRNDLLVGGIRPHYFCLPILKRSSHQAALCEAATSGNPRFFLGTDSAPHTQASKESACGCAGCYSAHAALELYAEVFDACNALDRLEGFASHFGADFYGLPRNDRTITLERIEQSIPESLSLGGDVVVPLRAGGRVQWQIRS
ncbi:dihydroorotase, homodimeric type [Luminiphilus syltensis NOR5-1B]|uniref:Dihydroorotase n=1 Tax=Luminiphilus syltensis NOR5-1B TaxID=565045 RepID=B8KRX2_9GAMM|nr:dihydroorotase [Luminiphilus syltensis]EED36828.1 dihydroorotase, homodimeric type [Luminiphilus syltensis NOR5-1B]